MGAHGERAAQSSSRAGRSNSMSSSSILPASTLEKSRMSLIRTSSASPLD